MKTHAEHATLLWRALPRHPYLVLRALRRVALRITSQPPGHKWDEVNAHARSLAWIGGHVPTSIRLLHGDAILRAAVVALKPHLIELEASPKSTSQ